MDYWTKTQLITLFSYLGDTVMFDGGHICRGAPRSALP